MKPIAIIVMLACTIQAGIAQNRANIQGKLVDSANNEAVDYATVAVVNAADSSLLSYTLSKEGGQFALHSLPAGKDLRVIISLMSYNTFHKVINLQKGETLNLGTIRLAVKASALKEVNINGSAPPVVMRKDTIEFSAEAFKTPPNAVVEELLKRLPGIEVDMNGNITVNGKKVKLLVNGKRYFANDPRIASQNLDAALVDKVQLYDDREDDPDHLIPDAEVNKIINLKLKAEIKKSVGGKLHGGIGSRDRFDAGLLYNMFRDTLQISLIGIGNNLNKTGFTNGDLTSLGGFNRSGSDQLYNGSISTGGRAYGGIETVASGGANINTDYGKKLKLNLLYFYSHTDDVYNSTSMYQQFFSDTTLSSNSTSNRNYTSNKHNISALVEWNPDTATKIRYQPAVSFGDNNNISSGSDSSYNNFSGPLNSNRTSNNNLYNSFQFQQSFSYYRKFSGKGASISISHNLNINPNNNMAYSVNDITSYTAGLLTSDLVRLGDNASHSASSGLTITYRYPFTKKFIGDVSLNGGYSRNHGRLFTYDQDPATGLYNIYIDSLSKDLTRTQFTETVRPELTFMLTKRARLVANVGVQFMQVYSQFNKNFPDINRYDTYLLPSLSYSDSKLSVNYADYVNPPSIDNMYPDTLVYSQLSSRAGNPDLKPSRTHNLYVSYYFNKTETMVNYNVYGSFSLYQNSTFFESVTSPEGATFSRPINKSGSYYAYTGMGMGKSFKKFGNWQIRLNTNLSSNFSHNFFQANNKEGFQNDISLSLTQQIFVSWNNKVDINPSYNINPTISYYQNVAYKSLRYATQNLSFPATIKAVKHMTFEAQYTYTYNPQVGEGMNPNINILNLSVARQFQFRDRGEIKISCFDLFDQSVNSYRLASGNSIIRQQNQILKRYFMLSYAYRFTSTATKNNTKK